METIQISIDAGQPVKSFNHFYCAVGYANVDYTRTACGDPETTATLKPSPKS